MACPVRSSSLVPRPLMCRRGLQVVTAWGRAVELSVGDAAEARLAPIARTEPASRGKRRMWLACREDPSFCALVRALELHHRKGQQRMSGLRPTLRSRRSTLVRGRAKNPRCITGRGSANGSRARCATSMSRRSSLTNRADKAALKDRVMVDVEAPTCILSSIPSPISIRPHDFIRDAQNVETGREESR
jgi:hypothetical protein